MRALVPSLARGALHHDDAAVGVDHHDRSPRHQAEDRFRQAGRITEVPETNQAPDIVA